MKIKHTKYPVLEVIRKRWSPRAFSNESITERELNTIFEAASCAPSAFNEQPWFYVYSYRGEESFQKMLDCVSPLNVTWAKRAAVLVLAIALKDIEGNYKNPWAKHDVGAANMTLLLQATELGIYGHPIGGFYKDEGVLVTGHRGEVGFDKNKIRDLFDIREPYEVVTILALGRLGSPEILDEPYRSDEVTDRPIRPVEEFAFKNSFALKKVNSKRKI